jgi:hypothetical protein
MAMLGSEQKLAELRWLLRGGRVGAVRNLVRNVGALMELIDDSSAAPWRSPAAIVLAIGYVATSVDAKADRAN